MFLCELNDEEETFFRKWAHENYTPFSDISDIWHPVIQDECKRINEAVSSGLLAYWPGKDELP